MRTLLLATLVLIGSGSAASAVLIGVTGGAPADFSASYTSRDLIGAPDSWPDSGAVTNGVVAIDPGSLIEVIFRGGEDDAWSADFGDGRSFTSASAPGDRITGLSPADFLALFFSNEGGGNPLTDASVALQVFGSTLEIGWDGTLLAGDYGYRRLLAIVTPLPVPAPAGLPLLAGALAALCAAGWRRGVKRGGSSASRGRLRAAPTASGLS